MFQLGGSTFPTPREDLVAAVTEGVRGILTLPSGKAVEWDVPLRDHDHVFLKGHRIMVQVQSTWFPVIDRNPQKFVPSIYKADAADYMKATQRVYETPEMPSHIELPVAK